VHKARVRTLQALASGTPSLAAHPRLPDIQAEFGEVYAVRKVRRADQRRLMEVLHSTRALDTALAVFVDHHGCLPSNGRKPTGLGQYLYALRDHSVSGLSRLAEGHRQRFNAAIARPRNRYLHQAATFPASDAETQVLLAEMAALVTVVIRL
jgi:hypothetical protein